MAPERAITAALKAIDRGQFSSVRAAAAAYGVPRVTLQARKNGRVQLRTAREAQQLLSPEQEKLLIKWIEALEASANAPTHSQLREMANLVLSASKSDKRVGATWAPRFIKRYKLQLRSKKGVKIDQQRVKNATPSVISDWFKQLAFLVRKYRILASNTYNMDETGLALGVCDNENVVGTAATKSAIIQRPENREWISIIECIRARGGVLTPVVIFKGKNVQYSWFNAATTAEWRYTASESAYTNDIIGLTWLREVFIPETAAIKRKGQYRLLILDGHTTHDNIPFMWECFQNDIIPYYLPPHTTHFLQPLDVACFSSLKKTYRKSVAANSYLDDSAPVKKQRFIEFYQAARQQAFNDSNIESAFSSTGIFPLDANKVLNSRFIVRKRPQSDEARVDDDTTDPTMLYNTPRSHRQLRVAVATVSDEQPIARPLRQLLFKTGKGFDDVQFELAEAQRLVSSLQARCEAYDQKKKRKVAVDPNKRFIEIEDIVRRQEEEERLERHRAAAASLIAVREAASQLVNQNMNAVVQAVGSINTIS